MDKTNIQRISISDAEQARTDEVVRVLRKRYAEFADDDRRPPRILRFPTDDEITKRLDARERKTDMDGAR